MKRFVSLLFLFALFCADMAFAQSLPGGRELKISTTTSVENSGLLQAVLPPFEKLFGYKTSVIAVGTGAALKLAAEGNVDITIVHSKTAEDRFIAEGNGINRRELWYNDFVIVGPEDDPAGVARAKNAAEAFAIIEREQAMFISRGDKSGTHDRERAVWRVAEIDPQGKWYVEAGSGMGAVLIMATERGAYTLADRGTYLVYRKKTGLKVIFAGDPIFKNEYSIIAVNPDRHRHVNYYGAMALIGWLSSIKGQKIAADLLVGGEKLFKPLAVGKP
jgi:tungstate transport system substrate-binding protein